MKFRLRFSKKKTFAERLLASAFYWGLPAMCLELIGIPRQSWGLILIFEIPGTIVGVFVGALIEHGIASHLRQKPNGTYEHQKETGQIEHDE